MRNSRLSLEKGWLKVVAEGIARLAKTRTVLTVIQAAILACLTVPLACAAPDSTLIPASNLRREAAETAHHGQPLLILYSRENCPYCEEVRRTWLAPLAREAKQSGLKVRQIDQDSDQPLVDFAGKATTHSRFAAAQKISFVPVVAVYGPKGQLLAESIVGVRLRDFYNAYLEMQLDEARTRLRQP